HQDGSAIREYGAEEVVFNNNSFADTSASFAVNIYDAGQFTLTAAAAKGFDQTWAAVAKGKALPAGSGTAWVEAILGWRYPHANAVGKPAKLTVSEIKRRLEYMQEDAHTPPEYLEEAVSPAPPFARPRFLQETTQLTKIEYGTAVHALMQHVDFQGDLSAAGLKQAAQKLVRQEILLPNQAEALNYQKIAAFFSAELGQRLVKAAKVWREIPFSLMLDAGLFYPELRGAGEEVFVQGIIDCLFLENGEAVIIDYKTDKAVLEKELAGKYAAQLGMYSVAAEAILKINVKEEYIYSFALSQAIELKGLG
ncbi:MAG: PD-(D/E)XK nuclease family protein, partial [Sporomusaceae bacterium]|nr:PD-(D/E)XK nuclease family protein [Sporomusaceae bacterium]